MPPSADLLNCSSPKELDWDAQYEALSKRKGKTYLKDGTWELRKDSICGESISSVERSMPENSSIPELGASVCET